MPWPMALLPLSRLRFFRLRRWTCGSCLLRRKSPSFFKPQCAFAIRSSDQQRAISNVSELEAFCAKDKYCDCPFSWLKGSDQMDHILAKKSQRRAATWARSGKTWSVFGRFAPC